MRLRWLIVALLCAAAPASAFWQSRDSNYNQNVVSGGVVFSLTEVSAQNETTGGTSVTYNCGSSCSFGAADANRIIAVFISSRQSTVNTITGVTIDGNAATLVSGSVAQQNGTNGTNSAIYYYALGAGSTSGNVVATFGASAARSCMVAYRIITSTPTPAAGTPATVTSGTSLAQTIALPAGGGGFQGAYTNSAVTAPGFTHAISDFSNTTTSTCAAGHMTASNPSFSWTGNQSGTSSAATWNP